MVNKKKAEMDPDSSDSDDDINEEEEEPEISEKEFKTMLSQMFPSKYMNEALAKLEKEERK